MAKGMTPAVDGLVLTDDHEYFFRGKRVAGVTEVLTANKLVDYGGQWYNERNRQLGTILHQACALLAEDRLDWDTVDPEIYDSVRAFEVWFAKMCEGGRHPLLIEGSMYSEREGFAGTIDLGLSFTNPALGREVLVVDLKRGVADKTCKLQTAGYGLLVSETFDVPIRLIKRYALNRLGTGAPRMIPFQNRSDYDAFKGALAVRNWLANEGSVSPVEAPA
jgi:hypothetical protein